MILEIYDCKIIICGPAIGKTYLAEHDDRFIDLDEIKANYKYGLYNATREEMEKGKLNRVKVVNEDSTKYAIGILEKELKNNKIILISSGNNGVVKYILDNKIKYCLVYAGLELLDEYKKRMIQRGNNSIFVDKIANEQKWEEDYIKSVNDVNATYKIELKKGQYLSDIKDRFFA